MFLDWVQITSVNDEDKISERRHTRQPRSEVQALLNCCFEDSVELNPNEITANPFNVTQIPENVGMRMPSAVLRTSPRSAFWIRN